MPKDAPPPARVQNTGNPLFDALVNLAMADPTYVLGHLETYHAKLRELALKEPGGLKTAGGKCPEELQAWEAGKALAIP
jgi:hypothetical protein